MSTDRSRRLWTLVSLLLLVAACGGESSLDSSTTTTTTSTTTSAPTTTLAPTTTTTTVPTTAPPDPPGALPLLDDGRPATWLGVTTDYEAVEVDTLTGEILRSIGQVSTAEEVATAECAACVNAIDFVWRTYDGAYFFVSQCCEPAAGSIHVLPEDQSPLLLDDLGDVPSWHFWWATPAPDSHEVVLLGYHVLITTADVTPLTAQAGVDYVEAWVNTESDPTFPISNAVWAGDVIRWLEGSDGVTRLRTFDRRDGSSDLVDVPDLAGWSLAGLTSRASGELVVVRSRPDGVAAEAIVLDVDGNVTGSFDVAAGARLGGYDRTGRFLVYTADDGVVRWHGEDDGGVLGEGFVHASW
ncbi:MAG TPA: hypothetical protein VLB67_15930 [Acidimicrobiia bacterium]|nr:hypothetical protein [Acidimicrobiia bacterium]